MKYEFYIINEIDRPYKNNIVQLIKKRTVRYLHWSREHFAKMKLSKRSTPLSDFGIDLICISNGVAFFQQTRPSVAKYADGEHRFWQGEDSFLLDVIEDI